jgi:LmbE family N-acetylglucosaminyl deacetylase
MRIIYLSPHLDDAVLSAGGLIRAQSDAGIPVEIWTIMSGIPVSGEPSEFAQMMHRIWGFSSGQDCVQSRRLEDQRAAAEVGASPLHFDFLDCIYRRGNTGQALYSDAAVPPHPEDAGLPSQIARAILGKLNPDDKVICQLAVGKHVDHVIVRDAAEMLGRSIVYDADMPYLVNHPGDLEPATVGLEASFQPISEVNFRSWMRAIGCYASQVDSVFGSHEKMDLVMGKFWQEQQGIRFWLNSRTSA